MKITEYLEQKIPKFLNKYPGFKIFLFKLSFLDLIRQDKESEEIYNFYNNYLLPMLQGYEPFINAKFNYEYIIDNPQILRTRNYQDLLESSCKSFESVLNINISFIFNPFTSDLYNFNFFSELNDTITNKSNQNKQKKILFKELYLLNNIENEVLKNCNDNKNEKINKPLNIFEPKKFTSLFYNDDQMIEENDFEGDQNKHFGYFNPPFNALKNDLNNINNNFSDLLFNPQNCNNINVDGNCNSTNTIDIFSSTKCKRMSNEGDNNKNYTKLPKSAIRKSKIKEFKFRALKRENIDKKIIRKFKKYLKIESKKLKNTEIIHYLNNSEFWFDFINSNLMPPFKYNKEKKEFRSFNTQYLEWFFEHKYSLDLYNIFIKENFNSILLLFGKSYFLTEENEEYSLLRNYINKLPLIYGKEKNLIFSNDIDIKSIDEDDKEEIKNKNDENRLAAENIFEDDNNYYCNFNNNINFVFDQTNAINISNMDEQFINNGINALVDNSLEKYQYQNQEDYY